MAEPLVVGADDPYELQNIYSSNPNQPLPRHSSMKEVLELHGPVQANSSRRRNQDKQIIFKSQLVAAHHVPASSSDPEYEDAARSFYD